MTVQRRNAEMVELLRTDFQHRDEANFAWRAAVSEIQTIPMVRGAWPMSAVNGTPAVLDLSGQGRTLTYNGNPLFNAYGLAPYINLDGTGDYLSRADEAGLDVLGTETYVTSSRRGVALGGWFWADALGGTQALISKWDEAGNQRSYNLTLNAGGTVTGRISDDGTYAAGHYDNLTSSNTISAEEWFFAAFTWSGTGGNTTMSIWLNGTRTDGVPARAAIFNGTADFCIGAYHGGLSLLDGRASLCWLAASCLAPVPANDVLGFSLYQQARRMYQNG